VNNLQSFRLEEVQSSWVLHEEQWFSVFLTAALTWIISLEPGPQPWGLESLSPGPQVWVSSQSCRRAWHQEVLIYCCTMSGMQSPQSHIYLVCTFSPCSKLRVSPKGYVWLGIWQHQGQRERSFSALGYVKADTLVSWQHLLGTLWAGTLACILWLWVTQMDTNVSAASISGIGIPSEESVK
jgi:hypothetical protein